MTAGPTISTSGAISVPSPTHTPSATWKPGMSSVDHLVEHVLVGAEVGVQRADVLPVALGDRAVERPAVGQELREDLGREVDRAVGLDESKISGSST